MSKRLHKGDDGRTVAAAEALYETWRKKHQARPSAVHPCGHTLNNRRRCVSAFPQREDPCHIPGLDHAETFSTPGRRVAVHHPYGAPDQEDIDAFDERWGTETRVFPPEESWYYPNYSHRVEVWGPAR